MSRTTDEKRRDRIQHFLTKEKGRHACYYSEPKPLGVVLTVMPLKNEAQVSTGVYEIRAMMGSYTAIANTFQKIDLKSLNELVSEQILKNCKLLNDFFDKITNTSQENYTNLNFHNKYHNLSHLQTYVKVRYDSLGLSNDIVVFRKNLAKIIFENYKLLSAQLKDLNPTLIDEAKNCLAKLKENNQRIIKDTAFVELIYTNKRLDVTNLNLN